MLLEAWVFIGKIGLAISLVTLYFAAKNTKDDDGIVILGGTLGFITWGVWAYGALYIEAPVSGAQTLSFEEPAIAVLGVGLAVSMGVLALTGPLELASRWRTANPEDF